MSNDEEKSPTKGVDAVMDRNQYRHLVMRAVRRESCSEMHVSDYNRKKAPGLK